MSESNFNPEYLERIAKVCHEASRTYLNSIGEKSFNSWEESEDWQKKTIIDGVAYRINNPQCSVSAFHDIWAQEKMAQGWKYGEEKNSELKTHPCLVPFNDLPAYQKINDTLIMNIIDTVRGKRDILEEHIDKLKGSLDRLKNSPANFRSDSSRKFAVAYTHVETAEYYAKDALALREKGL